MSRCHSVFVAHMDWENETKRWTQWVIGTSDEKIKRETANGQDMNRVFNAHTHTPDTHIL